MAEATEEESDKFKMWFLINGGVPLPAVICVGEQVTLVLDSGTPQRAPRSSCRYADVVIAIAQLRRPRLRAYETAAVVFDVREIFRAWCASALEFGELGPATGSPVSFMEPDPAELHAQFATLSLLSDRRGRH